MSDAAEASILSEDALLSRASVLTASLRQLQVVELVANGLKSQMLGQLKVSP